jgi:hypothetical protein
MIWKVMLLGILLDLLLIAVATMSKDSPMNLPGGFGYLAKAMVPLLVDGFGFLWVMLLRVRHRYSALRPSTGVGIAGGLALVTHMPLENFGN